MCSFCPGNYEDPDETTEVPHGFRGIERVDAHRTESGYAEMDGEVLEYLCECGERFDTEEELRWHMGDMTAAQGSNANTRFLIVALLLGGL